MAHLQTNYPNILKKLIAESPCHKYGSVKHSNIIGLLDQRGQNCKDAAGHKGRIRERKRSLERECGFMVQCSSPSASSAEGVEMIGKVEEDRECAAGKAQFGHLVSEYGWKVRRLVERIDEMRMAAQVQAEAFHVPVALFDSLFFQFFQAEVLSGLVYKLRNSPPDRYACLVAVPSTGASGSHQKVVGVVDVTALRDEAVLQHLQGAEEYLYVSGIAVLNNYRRQKVATVLLKACDMLCLLWGFEFLVLRAYEDDWGARKLYTNAGYKVVSGDPVWTTTWIGRKRRVLMIKHSRT